MGKKMVVEVNGELVNVADNYGDDIEGLITDYGLDNGDEVEVFVSKGMAKVSKKIELIFPKSGK